MRKDVSCMIDWYEEMADADWKASLVMDCVNGSDHHIWWKAIIHRKIRHYLQINRWKDVS